MIFWDRDFVILAKWIFICKMSVTVLYTANFQYCDKCNERPVCLA